MFIKVIGIKEIEIQLFGFRIKKHLVNLLAG